jgi:hypothetical protein
MASTANEVVNFMENIKAVKEKESPFKKVKSKNKDTNKKTDTSSRPKKKKFYCSHHGPNNSHETKDCLVIKNKGRDKSSGNKKSTNKTWVRKAAEANSASKKELAAVVEKGVKKGVKKQLAAMSSKKRKEFDSDDESETKDCFLLEELSKGIEGFNYNDMEKLTLEGSDEVSV